MIFERAAASVLVVACLLQAFRPSRMITSQSWRSIDIRIGWFQVQATNGADSVRPAGYFSARTHISLVLDRRTDIKRLRICMSDGGCMTARLDATTAAPLADRR